jgi:hypothetical protein
MWRCAEGRAAEKVGAMQRKKSTGFRRLSERLLWEHFRGGGGPSAAGAQLSWRHTSVVCTIGSARDTAKSGDGEHRRRSGNVLAAHCSTRIRGSRETM